MHVVAVVELDWLLSQHENHEPNALYRDLVGQISALKQCRNIDNCIFTRSEHTNKLPLAIQQELNLTIIECSEIDPLTAFYQAVQDEQQELASAVDKPLIIRLKLYKQYVDPQNIDAMVNNHVEQGHHYSRNQYYDESISPLVEIMNFEVLYEAWREAILPDDRLEITPYIYRQQQRLNVGYFPPESNTLLIA